MILHLSPRVILVFGLISGFSAVAYAADSALPHLPFPMPVADYPQEALVANQEGAVTLRATIGLDAKMTNVSVVETSGHPILDDAAVLVLRNAQLSQPPMTPDDQPTSADVLVDANWVLPLESAASYLPNIFPAVPHPQASDRIVPIMEAPDSRNAVSARDYPPISIRQMETGRTGVYILVATDGSVRDVHLASSSGYERLDEATLRVTRRFTYAPGTINGVLTEMWTPQRVVWALISGNTTRGAPGCEPRPLVDPFERRSRVAPDEALPEIDRWTRYSRDGDVIDGLILTEQGWMKLAPALIDVMNARPGPGVDARRPEPCWYYDGLNPMMRE